MKAILVVPAAAIGLFTTYIVACSVIARKMIVRFAKKGQADALGIEYGDAALEVKQSAERWLDEHPQETVHLTSRDGLSLSAHWWDSECDATVIYVHGYGNDGSQAALIGDFLSETLGVNILAPDCRAHGGSEGKYIGFGWPDRFDLLDWVNWLNARKGTAKPVFLVGLSMGASAVVSAAGEDIPDNVRGAVADCGYSSLAEMAKYLLREKFHLSLFPFMPMFDHFFIKHFGYSLYAVRPVDAAARSRVPMLFIHGEKDSFIPPSMCRELYAACPAKKELLIVPDAGHAMSAVIQPQLYKETFSNFFYNSLME